MSDNTQEFWKNVTPGCKASPELEAEIAAFNANLEAKAAAQEAAARQEQKDIIKEAIIEALNEVLTSYPLRGVLSGETYRISQSR